MKKIIIALLICNIQFGLKAQTDKVDISQYKMSNNTSPAFLLIDESPTSIYTTNNIKALSLHVLDNFGESLSIEVAPYFFINKNSSNRTYYKYIGVEKNMRTGNLDQNVFSGINNTTISVAYVDKEFEGIGAKRKVYSLGVKIPFFRWYSDTDLNRTYQNAESMANLLAAISPPNSILLQGREAIKEYYNSQSLPFQKTYKPTFRLDGAIAYSALFKENTTNSATVNRLGSWITGELSILLNSNSNSSSNSYFNLLFTGRYIEDEFNINENGIYSTNYYRDLGGKVEFEFNDFAFSYEYISRNGTVESERSVGNVKYTINKNLSITGGFGKDFAISDENLLTIFGINWGVNFGDSNMKIK
ncbi:hypothetical protein [Kordia sp.]|uniref:hypothetical protein n=1 Tax=Kordia sp. TaxID=1965332 RepID=UPI003D2C03E3